MDSILNKLHVAEPVKRDNKNRVANIPESVTRQKELVASGVEIPKRITEKDKEREINGAGVYDKDDKRT